ncbi:MAG: ABC transporter substrate-binding protein [Candidatus Taylorbacteria bacterium]|nr:ABC transporter substrate-binding protein [Candidatus Taylorbacteria bacterium]
MNPAEKTPVFKVASIAIAFLVLAAGIGYFYVSTMDGRGSKRPSTGGMAFIGERNFSEAPELAEKVAKGELPPVGERLPKNPLIVVPHEKLGKYGGTWHLVAKSKSDHNAFLRYLGYENLVRWNASWTGIIPNIAQSYNVSSDSREYTFYLRDGLKWSDGKPFTADDIMFWYEDVFLDKVLTPVYQDWLIAGGKPVKVERLGDRAVKFSFEEPNSLFLQSLAHPKGGEIVSYPKHALSGYHPKYNPDIDQAVKDAGAKDWADLFQSKFGNIGTPDNQTRWQHPEIPTLNAWVLQGIYGKDAPLVAARNPYYWKIDPTGNQLPYINRLEYAIEDDSSKIIDLVLAGKVDMQDRNVGSSMISVATARAAIEDGATKGGYHLFKTVFATMNTMMISLNLNHKDPALREIFQNKDFRIGLSHALNRERIIDLIFAGYGIPYQGAPRPESPFYDEEMAKQYTEYDVAKANGYLDRAGLKERDSAGYRKRPDGKRLTFTVDWGDAKALALIQEDWKAVGIDMKIGNTTDRTAFYSRKSNLDHDAAVWTGDGGIDVMQEPRYYFPFGSTNESNYALAWGYWFTSPDNPLAEEPPEIVKEQMSLYREIRRTADEAKQNELMARILDIAKDQFYAIGVSLPVDGFGIVRDGFKNVPEAMPAAFVYPNPAPTNPSQYFIE